MSLYAPSDSTQLKTRIALLILCSVSATILLMSNLTDYYDVIWRKLDIGVFRILNDTITPDGIMTQFWALTNSKNFDRLTFVVMLGLCIYIVASTERKERISATARIGAIAVLILIAVTISKKVLGDFHHPSPGYVLAPFNNLNDFISGYTVKTATDHSFPGDHAMTSALFAGGILILFRRPYVALISLLLMVFVSVPRLAGGGHWLTDVIVGGGAACLLLLPWIYVIPLVDWIEKGITWGWSKAPAFLKK